MNLKQFPKRLDSKTSCLRITVPENLDLALEGLIRKVLREQPKTDDIYSFAANYFETLLKIRDKAGANYATTQLCPFHNDEDAHEMIKIAGTFTKPERYRKTNEEKVSKKVVVDQKKKDVRRPQPVREKKTKKQSTPDLIKKLPVEIKPEIKTEEKVEIEGEFLTSDPIKELVEKELMLEGKVKKDKKDPGISKTSEVKSNNKVQQDEQRKDFKTNQESAIREVALPNQENLARVEEEKTNTEEPNGSHAKEKNTPEGAEILQNLPEETPKAESQQETTQTLTEDENVQQEEKDKLEAEKEGSQCPEKESLLAKLSEKQEIKTDGRKHEEKVETAQQSESEIHDEPEATNESTAETAVKSDAVALENELKSGGSLEEGQIIAEELKETENYLPNISRSEEQSDRDGEIQETVSESEKQQKNGQSEESENKEEKDKVSQAVEETVAESQNLQENEQKLSKVQEIEKEELSLNEKGSLEIPEETTEDVKDEKTEETKAVEKAEKAESVGLTEVTEEIKKNYESETAKTLQAEREENPGNSKTEIPQIHQAETETTESDKSTEENKDIKKDVEKSTEPVMEAQNIQKNEEKPKADEKIQLTDERPTEADHENTQRKNESETQNSEQPDIDKKNEEEEQSCVTDNQNIPNDEKKEEITKSTQEDTNSEELCMVVNGQSIPKKDKANKNKTELPDNGNKDGQTITEDLQTTADNKNVPENKEEDKTNLEELPKEVNAKNIEIEDKIHKNEREVEENTQSNDDQINEDELCMVVDTQSIPNEVKVEKGEETVKDKQEENPEELCRVVDIENIPKEDENKKAETLSETDVSQNDDKTNPKIIMDAKNIPESEDTGSENSEKVEAGRDMKKEQVSEKNEAEKAENEIQKEEIIVKRQEVNREKHMEEDANEGEGRETENSENENKESKINLEEVNTDNVEEDVKNKQEGDQIGENKAKDEPKIVEIQPPDIIEPENQNIVKSSEEVQIKTIQTHYYDTLQVPEIVTKEYIVHNVATPPINTLVGVAHLVPQAMDEILSASPPDKQQQEMETTTQISDPDDLLDIMTPTSGYSLNVSEISWQTVNGMFLDSERRYSSLEKEETRYSTVDQNQEVEEVIQKTVIPIGVDAVPVPPRDVEEITEEESNTENVKQKKSEGDSEGSTESRSGDSDVPFISVEVKTVIETQVVDEEENDIGRQHPSVEVTVEATIDIQDDEGMPQSEPDFLEKENKISETSQTDVKQNLEKLQSTNQDLEQKESSSTEQTAGKEGSSAESDTTVSSAVTEIKRTDSSKRNFSSTRSLLSTQSLDLGKRNPLMKTRSLSTFRHGVTDFEVWNTIEKELEEAATKIQSKFRGYKTRKKLQRENAVQITTEESSPSTTPNEAEGKEEGQQSTGEFHDSIVLAEHPR